MKNIPRKKLIVRRSWSIVFIMLAIPAFYYLVETVTEKAKGLKNFSDVFLSLKDWFLILTLLIIVNVCLQQSRRYWGRAETEIDNKELD